MATSLTRPGFASSPWLGMLNRDHAVRYRSVLSIFLIASGIALFLTVVLGVFDGRRLGLWFLAVVGAGLCIAGIGLRLSSLAFSVAVFWLFIGSAAQLYVTEPLWYNVLFSPLRSSVSLAMYLAVGLQLLFAVAVLVANVTWPQVRHVLQGFGLTKLAIFLLLGTGFSVSILIFIRNGDMPGYYVQIAAYAVLLAVNLLSVLAVYASQPRRTVELGRLLSPPALVAFAFLASASVAWFAFERIGHVADEVSYIFQARTFAGGALWVPALPLGAQPAFDHFQLMFDGDRWFSPLAPGWPAVLTLGVIAGLPWLFNPLLGAASVALGYGILARYADVKTARIGCLLLATSPWLIGLSATFMTHTLSLFLTLAAWYLLLLGKERKAGAQAALAIAAGLAMGWLFLTRPLDGIIIGGLTGVLLLLASPRQTFLTRIVPFGVGCIGTGALVFPYNAAMTGNPLKTAMGYYFDATWEKLGFANRLGFGEEVGSPIGAGQMELNTQGHSAYEGLINTLNNINSLHTDFLGWSIGSLAFVWAFLLWGRPGRSDLAPIAVIVVIVFAYSLYWFTGSHYVGPRYWFIAILPLVYLVTRGIMAVANRMPGENDAAASGRLLNTVVVLCLCGSIVFLSYRSVARFHHFRGYHDHFRQLDLKAENGIAPLVLAVGDVGNIGSAYFLNDPFLAPENPVFAKDLGPGGNAALFAAFPDRPVVRIEESDLNLRSRADR